MKSDVNGISSCENKQEQYEDFVIGGIWRVQYDYRADDGELFSCIAKTLEMARARRDEWDKDRHTI